jgi:ubiquinone/menaquinone biosynthesis C-methylase UbiE
MRRCFLVILSGLITLSLSLCRAQGTHQEEADRLAVLLNWQPGTTVAEIGAGQGQMTLAAAKRVGKVYTTELDGKMLANLEQLAATEKNIIAVKAAEAETNLPPECCDSIFMRFVYHHLTKPIEIDKSLYRSLKPGGLLAVIDEEPPPGSSKPEGVPENRGGHGMPQKLLIEELTSVGFQFVKALDDWPNKSYCAVFRRHGS